MHELSIAQSILDICDSNIPDKSVKVKEIELEIGQLSGVVIEALETAMSQMIKNTIYQNAEIKINLKEALGKCISCGHEFKPEDYYSECPKCGNYGIELLKGDEMRVKSIELM
jgi:hydrogenase nickel incorporation protein HypA/HybF